MTDAPGNFAIHHADAMEKIPELGDFDYLLSDPPYTTNSQSGSPDAADTIARSRRMLDNMSRSFLMEAIRKIGKRTPFTAWLFCAYQQVSYLADALTSEGLYRQCLIVWDKDIMTRGRPYFRRHELVLMASNAPVREVSQGPDLIRIKGLPGGQRDHPFAKPPGLARALMAPFPPGRVIDPFCGSGGLLKGAIDGGNSVIGIDIDERSVEDARRRLANRNMQLALA